MSDGRLTVKLSLLLTESSGFTFPTAAIVAIVIFVLLVLSLVLLYIFRVKKILQLETCGCIYTAVKTADPDANV